jgi:phosphatidate cytidylyltransferase
LLATRIVTALILGVAVAGSLLYLPTRAAAAVLAVLWLMGGWEWAGLARLGRIGRGVYVVCLALPMAAVLIVGPTPTIVLVALVFAVPGWLAALLGVLSFPRAFGPHLVLLAGFVALLPGWIVLTELLAVPREGPLLALLALAVVWAADVGAYFVGRMIGRVKLAPKVSPGKTWEGVGGGVALAVIVAALAAVWLGRPAPALAAVALVTALVSVVGDLTVSMLKRNVGLKDTGSLLPGHGGVMDRIDGLVAAIPFFALGLHAFGLLY